MTQLETCSKRAESIRQQKAMSKAKIQLGKPEGEYNHL
jgi:hypothetical protein